MHTQAAVYESRLTNATIILTVSVTIYASLSDLSSDLLFAGAEIYIKVTHQ